MQRTSSRSNILNLTLNNYSQTDVSRNSSFILYFIIPAGLTKTTCSRRLTSAQRLCMDHNLNSEWMSEAKLLTKIPQSNNVYVLDPFSGTAYDYLEGHFLKSKKFMIIGPQCIRYAVQRPEATGSIESKGYPFCSLAMQYICLTLTGFPKDHVLAVELTDLVQKMNGVVSKAYSAATTHVVAANTLTPKCREAYKNNVAVMKEGWIRAVWQECQDELIDATDGKFISYNCPVLHNIQICVSQVNSKEKLVLQKTITSHGGSVSKDFRRNVTDVLVIPFASGDKYKYAKQWRVPCVTPEWVEKSKQEGHVLPFEDFVPPRQPDFCSTQLDVDVPAPFPNLSNMTAFSAITDVAELPDVNNGGHVNATYLTDISVVSAPQHQVQEDVLNDTLEILRNASAGFLDGCTIYLCGHNSGDEKINEIRKILNSSGATRSNDISERLSHVLIINGKISDEEIRLIKALDNDPHIVSLEWLLQSAKEESPADEERFGFEIPCLKQKDKVTENVNPVASNIKPISRTTSFNALTGVSKPKIQALRQEVVSVIQRIEFESEIETPPPKKPMEFVDFKTPTRKLPTFDISPLLRQGMTDAGSKQLKRALDWPCEQSPISKKETRKSTPFRLVRGGFLYDMENKVHRLTQQSINPLDISEFASFSRSKSAPNMESEFQTIDDDDDGVGKSLVTSTPSQGDAKNKQKQDNLSVNEIKGSISSKEQFTKTVDKTSRESKNSTGYGSTNNSIVPHIESRRRRPSPPPRSRPSSLEAAAKFQALCALPLKEPEEEPHNEIDWNEGDGPDQLPSSENAVCLEPTRNKAPEEARRSKDDKIEPIPIKTEDIPSPPQIERRQTRQTKKISSSSVSCTNSRPPAVNTRRRQTGATKSREKTTSSSRRPYSFSLSGSTGIEKTTAQEVIEELGGNVSFVDFYDITANAVIAYKVSRSEKILGAIAGGRPILHPNYLIACHDAKKLLEFEKFMWKEVDSSSESEKNVVRAANYWYKEIKEDRSKMPYAKLRVFLAEQKGLKRDAYTRLIEAGGGKVSTDLSECNIVIGDGKEAISRAAEIGVPVKVPMFLNDVILSFIDLSFIV